MVEPERQREYDRKHYYKHRDKILKKQKERNRARSIVTKEIKKMDPREVLDMVDFEGI